MNTGLEDKVVLITGASGGIGGAMLDAFVAEGARVVAHGFRGADGLRTRVAARGWGDRVRCEAADHTDPDAVKALFERAVAAFGRVDVCVANAGRWPVAPRRLDETPVAELRTAIADNLLGAMWTARSFLATLARTGPRPDGHGGALLFTGSTAGRFGEARHVAYSTAKAGLRGLVRTLKNEIVAIDPWGRVNLVEPGWTATERVRATLDRTEFVGHAVQTMPLRQLARPEDIARAAVFLCSPLAARHVSGEILTVAGGMEGRRLWDPAEVDVDLVRERLAED